MNSLNLNLKLISKMKDNNLLDSGSSILQRKSRSPKPYSQLNPLSLFEDLAIKEMACSKISI